MSECQIWSRHGRQRKGLIVSGMRRIENPVGVSPNRLARLRLRSVPAVGPELGLCAHELVYAIHVHHAMSVKKRVERGHGFGRIRRARMPGDACKGCIAEPER